MRCSGFTTPISSCSRPRATARSVACSRSGSNRGEGRSGSRSQPRRGGGACELLARGRARARGAGPRPRRRLGADPALAHGAPADRARARRAALHDRARVARPPARGRASRPRRCGGQRDRSRGGETADAEATIALYRDSSACGSRSIAASRTGGCGSCFLRVGGVTMSSRSRKFRSRRRAKPCGGEEDVRAASRRRAKTIGGAIRPCRARRVPDADAARARLAASGVDVSEVRPGRNPGTRVISVKDEPAACRR